MSIAGKRLVEELLAPGLHTPVLDAQRGIARTQTFAVHGVFKTGPPEIIQQEFDIYRDLQIRLGHWYSSIFPQVVLRYRGQQLSVIEMTWLGHSLNDDIFKPMACGEWTAVLARGPDAPPIAARLAIADKAVSRTLDHLETLFAASEQTDVALATSVVGETVTALRTNLQRAGLLCELEIERDLVTIEASHDVWCRGLAISCCHRDLMVDHIHLGEIQGPLDVRLTDPRSGVPHFDGTPAGLARTPNSLGCAAVDFAHLELSLVRRELELKRIHPRTEVVALERVRTRVSDWVTRGRFTAAFYELALATWYANYAGWPAALGEAPPTEKQWLFEHMVTEARQSVARCAAVARAE